MNKIIFSDRWTIFFEMNNNFSSSMIQTCWTLILGFMSILLGAYTDMLLIEQVL
jgi:hypothetical protein